MESKGQRAKKFWQVQATLLVKQLMSEGNIGTFEELQAALAEFGLDNLETESLQQKVARGTFSTSFLLRVLLVSRRPALHSDDKEKKALAKTLDIGPTLNRLELGLPALNQTAKKR